MTRKDTKRILMNALRENLRLLSLDDLDIDVTEHYYRAVQLLDTLADLKFTTLTEYCDLQDEIEETHFNTLERIHEANGLWSEPPEWYDPATHERLQEEEDDTTPF